MDMEITTVTGKVYRSDIDTAPGFPGNPLTDADHKQSFLDCIEFASDWFSSERVMVSPR